METAENVNFLDSFRYMYFDPRTQLAPEIKLMDAITWPICFLPAAHILKHNAVEPMRTHLLDCCKISSIIGQLYLA